MARPRSTGAGLTERRTGARAEQKRRWDRAQFTTCIDCGTAISRRAERCNRCAAGTQARVNGKFVSS